MLRARHVASPAGKAKKNSLHETKARGLRRAIGGGRMPETLDEDARVRRLRDNVEDFLARVVDSDAPRPV